MLQYEQSAVKLGLVHQLQFVSSLQRMSVITKVLGENDFSLYCKGSPEMIISLSVPSTVPNDVQAKLKMYTEKGFRVIALGAKTLRDITYNDIEHLNRHHLENDLTFLGLIVMENRVKGETVPVIRQLKEANMKLVMITGNS